jgi:hypothetical protein
LKTGTSSVCQFYDSPRQLICFLRTFFRVREADLLKSTVEPIGQKALNNVVSHTDTTLTLPDATRRYQTLPDTTRCYQTLPDANRRY